MSSEDSRTTIYCDYLIAFVSDKIYDETNYAGKYGGNYSVTKYTYTQQTTNDNGETQTDEKSWSTLSDNVMYDFGDYVYQQLQKTHIANICDNENNSWGLYKITLPNSSIQLQLNNSNTFVGNGTSITTSNATPKSADELTQAGVTQFDPSNSTHYNIDGGTTEGYYHRQFIIVQFGWNDSANAIKQITTENIYNEETYVRPPLLTTTPNANQVLQCYNKYSQLLGFYKPTQNTEEILSNDQYVYFRSNCFFAYDKIEEQFQLDSGKIVKIYKQVVPENLDQQYFLKKGNISDIGYVFSPQNVGTFIRSGSDIHEIKSIVSSDVIRAQNQGRQFIQNSIKPDSVTTEEKSYVNGKTQSVVMQFVIDTYQNANFDIIVKYTGDTDQNNDGQEEELDYNVEKIIIQDNYTNTFYHVICQFELSLQQSVDDISVIMRTQISSIPNEIVAKFVCPYSVQYTDFGLCDLMVVTSSIYSPSCNASINAAKYLYIQDLYNVTDYINNETVFKDIISYTLINYNNDNCTYINWDMPNLKYLYVNGARFSNNSIKMTASFMIIKSSTSLLLIPKKQIICYANGLVSISNLPFETYYVTKKDENGEYYKQEVTIKYDSAVDLCCYNVQQVSLQQLNVQNLINRKRIFHANNATVYNYYPFCLWQCEQIYLDNITNNSYSCCTLVGKQDVLIKNCSLFNLETTGTCENLTIDQNNFTNRLDVIDVAITQDFIFTNNNKNKNEYNCDLRILKSEIPFVKFQNNKLQIIAINDSVVGEIVFQGNKLKRIQIQDSSVGKQLDFIDVVGYIHLSNVIIERKALRCVDCKNFTYTLTQQITKINDDLTQVKENSDSTWLLTKYKYDIKNQKRQIENQNFSLILSETICDNVEIIRSSYDNVIFNSKKTINIQSSYLRNINVSYQQQFNAKQLYSQICLLNNNKQINGVLLANQYPKTKSKISDSKINTLNCNDYDIFIQRTNIGQLIANCFFKLILLYDFIFDAYLKSVHELQKNIIIRYCQLGKLYVFTKGLMLDVNRYQDYLRDELYYRVQRIKAEYIQKHPNLEKYDFYSNEINIAKEQKLNQLLTEIDFDYFKQSDQEINFNIQNCTFCCLQLTTQSYCANVYHNIATQDCTYQTLSQSQTVQQKYNVNDLEDKYKQSIIFDDFQAVLFGFSNNTPQRIYMYNNKYISNFCVSGNSSKLKHLQLTNNPQLKSFDLVNNNILEVLKVKNCVLQSLHINKQTFPKLKNLQLINNEKSFDLGKKVYKNYIVLDDIIINQNNVDKSVIHDILKDLQYSNIFEEQNGFICKITYNNVIVYITKNKFDQIVQLFKNNGYIQNKQPNIKIYKQTTFNDLQISKDVSFQSIIVRDTDLEELELSGSAKYIDLSFNKLEEIKFTALSNVQYFNVSNNNLKCFYNDKLINTISNKKLTQCYFNNNVISDSLILNDNLIHTINVNNNVYLKIINLNNNRLADFIVDNTALNTVYIANQSYVQQYKENNTTIKKTIYTLKNFVCDNVDDINISNNGNLKKLICRNGKLDGFQLYKSALQPCYIQYVDISGSQLQYLDVTNCVDLQYLNVNNCSKLNFKFTQDNLTQLYCSNTGIEKLYIDKSKISKLDASFNKIKDIVLPITIQQVDLSNNNLYSVYLSLIHNNAKVNLRNNNIQIAQICNADNITSFASDYIQSLYLLENTANNFVGSLNFDNVVKLCFMNKNDQMQIREKTIQNVQLYCTQNITKPQMLFIQNCQIVNCKITSINNFDNKFGFILGVNNSKLEKLIIDYSYVKEINITNNYLNKIIITKPLYRLNKINIIQSNGFLDIQSLLNQIYNCLKHNNGGIINISSYKFNPYHQASQEIIQKLQSKNWQITLN